MMAWLFSTLLQVKIIESYVFSFFCPHTYGEGAINFDAYPVGITLSCLHDIS